VKDLLKKLVQAPSTLTDGELEAANVMAEFFAAHSINARIDNWLDSRANIIVHIKSAGQKPALLFAAHLDVVPPGGAEWKYPPFEAIEQDGRIYGRGSADMKAGIAAIAAAIAGIAADKTELKGDLVFAATAGEETDSCGAKRFVAQNSSLLPAIAGIVIPEPTNFDIVTAHRGMLWLKITTKGKAAHGSVPHLGINAISAMTIVQNRLEGLQLPHIRHPRLGGCSMSINEIHGGNATNVVADECMIKIDIRTVPGQSHREIIAEFQNILDELKTTVENFDAELAAVRSVEAMETSDSCEFIKAFCEVTGIAETTVVGFGTDGPFFKALNAPVVIFGPGRPDVCHKPDEYIDLADLEAAKEYYKNIILGFLT
jgi:succinyl-diaminopimelate desuccinylase